MTGSFFVAAVAVRPARRRDHAAAVRAATAQCSSPADRGRGRRAPRTGSPASSRCRPAWSAAAFLAWTMQVRGGLVASWSRWPSSLALVAAVRHAVPRPLRLGVRQRLAALPAADLRLRLPVAGRAAGQNGCELLADRARRRARATTRSTVMTVRRADLHADRARLPGVDVLGVPRPRSACPRRRTATAGGTAARRRRRPTVRGRAGPTRRLRKDTPRAGLRVAGSRPIDPRLLRLVPACRRLLAVVAVAASRRRRPDRRPGDGARPGDRRGLLRHVAPGAVVASDLGWLVGDRRGAGAARRRAGVADGAGLAAWSARTCAARRSAAIGRLGPAWASRQPAGRLVNSRRAGPGRAGRLRNPGAARARGRGRVVPGVVLARVTWADWQSGLILFACLPLVPLFMVLVGLTTKRQVQRRYAILGRLAGQFLDLLRGLTTLRIYGQAEAQERTLRNVTEAYRRHTLATLRVAFLSGLVLDLLAALSVAVVAVDIGLRLDHGARFVRHRAARAAARARGLRPAARRRRAAPRQPGGRDRRGRRAGHHRRGATGTRGDGCAAPRCAAASGSRRGRRLRRTPGTRARPASRSSSRRGRSPRSPAAAGPASRRCSPRCSGSSRRCRARSAPTSPPGRSVSPGSTWTRGGPMSPGCRSGPRPTPVDGRRRGAPRRSRRDRRGGRRRLPQLPRTGPGDAARRGRFGRLGRPAAAHRTGPRAAAGRRGPRPRRGAAGPAGRTERGPRPGHRTGRRVGPRPLPRLGDRGGRQPQRADRRDVRSRGLDRGRTGHRRAPAGPAPAAGPARARHAARTRAAAGARRRWTPPGRTGCATLVRESATTGRLAGAAGLAVLAAASGIGLTATSMWLISRAAQHPNVQALSIAVVGVRTFAIGRAVLRYFERLVDPRRRAADPRRAAGAGLRCAAAAAATACSAGYGRGDLLRRFVGDVDGVQEGLVRAFVPAAGALATAVGAVAIARPARARCRPAPRRRRGRGRHPGALARLSRRGQRCRHRPDRRRPRPAGREPAGRARRTRRLRPRRPGGERPGRGRATPHPSDPAARAGRRRRRRRERARRGAHPRRGACRGRGRSSQRAA